MIHLNLASEADLYRIAKMAHEIWQAHYVEIIGQEQVDYMLAKFYSHESLVEQITQKQHHFYLVEEDNEVIGFLSVSSENGLDYFLHKFYIYNQKSNSGAGTQTLNALVHVLKPNTLKLTVNRENFKSINFYFKNGFKISSVENFEIGNGYQMNDFVMLKNCKI